MSQGLQAAHELLEHGRELGLDQQLAGGVRVAVPGELAPPALLHLPEHPHVQWLHFVGRMGRQAHKLDPFLPAQLENLLGHMAAEVVAEDELSAWLTADMGQEPLLDEVSKGEGLEPPRGGGTVDGPLGPPLRPSFVAVVALVHDVRREEHASRRAAKHNRYRRFRMVAHLLRVFDTSGEDGALRPRIVLQIGLITIVDILWRDPGRSLLEVVEEGIHFRMGQGRPGAFDEVGFPDSQIRMTAQEAMDEILARQVVDTITKSIGNRFEHKTLLLLPFFK